MKPENLIKELDQYRAELVEIMGRFNRSSNSISINSKDDPRYRTIIIEMVDLLADNLGQNKYSRLISQLFDQGIGNYYQTPSYKSIEDITSVIDSAITRIKRNPEVLEQKNEEQPANQNTIETPPQITLKWLWEHVPARYVWSFFVLLFIVFTLGVQFGNTKLYKSLTVSANASTSTEAKVPNNSE